MNADKTKYFDWIVSHLLGDPFLKFKQFLCLLYLRLSDFICVPIVFLPRSESSENLSSDRLHLQFCHSFRVSGKTELFDLFYAGRSVGPEEKTEHPGDDVVELAAVVRIGKLRTVGARCQALLDTAGPHPAPRCSLIAVAAVTLLFQIRLARAAIQPAMGDQLDILLNGPHGRLLYLSRFK
jgi:hypothetical protein